MANKESDLDEIQLRLNDLTAKIEQIAVQLEGAGNKPHFAERVSERTKHGFEALADFIEEHPMRATVMAFLLGAVLFRGRH